MQCGMLMWKVENMENSMLQHVDTHGKFHVEYSNLKIPLRKFHVENSMLKIPCWKFHAENSMLKIPC
jgi:hypothetical protein